MDRDDKETVNMPSYSIEHGKWTGCVCVAVYELPWADEEGRQMAQLRQVSFNESAKSQFIKATLTRLPSMIMMRSYSLAAGFESLMEQGCTVKEITKQDLSFERFWSVYGYKVGNKATVKKKWEAMKEEDRLLAMQGIARQRRHSESHKTDMPYPQTYIDQRRWENVFTN
ncbi:MAG: hypothetical protein IJ684_02895 [Bacteroidales bacterium]|nr:hypothetical protein [Bacteroidales bacterium]